MPLNGLSILSLESRRASLVEKLIAGEGGQCFNAPSVRERPIEANPQALQFVRDLMAGRFDAVVLTTGVGTQYLFDAAGEARMLEPFLAALRETAIVSRGPKPAAVLRQHRVPVRVNVPEPNTWRETAEAMREEGFNRIAVQEYGVPNPELLSLLREQGSEVAPVPIYRWDLPEDLGPLEEACRKLAAGAFDIALLLSSVQLSHLLRVAGMRREREAALAQLRERVVVASIGPVMTDALLREGLRPDFTPRHPKLAVCIRQLAQQAAELVERKRTRPGQQG